MVVVSSSNALDAGDDPDAVLRSPGRFAVFAAAGFLGRSRARASWRAGAFAPLGDDETRSWVPIAVGAWLVAAGGLGLHALTDAPSPAGRHHPASGPHRHPRRPGRRRAPPAESGRAAAITLAFLGSALGISMVVAADGLVLVMSGVIIALRMGAVGVVGLRRRSTLRLTPDGLLLPGGATPPESLPWAHVRGVGGAGRLAPAAGRLRQGRRPATMRLAHQAWPPSALVEVLEHFRTHPRDRSALTDPAALDRFRH